MKSSSFILGFMYTISLILHISTIMNSSILLKPKVKEEKLFYNPFKDKIRRVGGDLPESQKYLGSMIGGNLSFLFLLASREGSFHFPTLRDPTTTILTSSIQKPTYKAIKNNKQSQYCTTKCNGTPNKSKTKPKNKGKR